MDDKLEQLSQELPPEVAGNPWTIHPTRLAAWSPGSFLPTSGHLKALLGADKYLLDRVACYVGECFRKNLGGVWEVDSSSPDGAYFGLPVVRRAGELFPTVHCLW